MDHSRPTVVLVHGAWSDGSSWRRVIPILLNKGIPAIVVQNPTTSLAEDVAATQRALDTVKGLVVLGGHSWGVGGARRDIYTKVVQHSD
jgi:pimeloyl-ACP methyl ester carboxylesterase